MYVVKRVKDNTEVCEPRTRVLYVMVESWGCGVNMNIAIYVTVFERVSDNTFNS